MRPLIRAAGFALAALLLCAAPALAQQQIDPSVPTNIPPENQNDFKGYLDQVMDDIMTTNGPVILNAGNTCQGRSKIRLRWRRKTRPSVSWAECLNAAGQAGASGRRVGRVLAGSLAVLEPIAVAVQLQDVDVMGQPIEQRAGESFGAEDLGPFIEGQIRGHQR